MSSSNITEAPVRGDTNLLSTVFDYGKEAILLIYSVKEYSSVLSDY